MYEDFDSVAYDLYCLHEGAKEIPEKIKAVTEKYKILKDKAGWDTLKNFFENPIYVNKAYICETESNNHRCGEERKYIKCDISHEEAVKGNIYFYILLAIIDRKFPITAGSIYAHNKGENPTEKKARPTKKTAQYLYELGKKNNLQYESDAKLTDKYFLCIKRVFFEPEVYGHKIFESIELPI